LLSRIHNYITSPAAWRAWLEKNHQSQRSVRLVY
jgi:hypothetical protein